MENKTKLPVGYWIKQADRLLTGKIDEIQSAFGLTRTGWQLLNSINENSPAKRNALINLMLPFSDKDNTIQVLAEFNRNQITAISNREEITLTEKGKQLFTACFEKQKQFRQKAMQNISEQEYQTTLATLQKIITNIEE
ncbi:MAG: winged helix-turn-helix transcriptional regulator [Prolixibacteraceae bacterium]|nr:winged helix-turn-helix transcriptional regulator [Prolixibacteraceae bacterium]